MNDDASWLRNSDARQRLRSALARTPVPTDEALAASLGGLLGRVTGLGWVEDEQGAEVVAERRGADVVISILGIFVDAPSMLLAGSGFSRTSTVDAHGVAQFSDVPTDTFTLALRAPTASALTKERQRRETTGGGARFAHRTEWVTTINREDSRIARTFPALGGPEALTAPLTWARVAAGRTFEPEVTEIDLPDDVWRLAGGARGVIGSVVTVEPFGGPEAITGVRVAVDVDPEALFGALVVVDKDDRRYQMRVDVARRSLSALLPPSVIEQSDQSSVIHFRLSYEEP